MVWPDPEIDVDLYLWGNEQAVVREVAPKFDRSFYTNSTKYRHEIRQLNLNKLKVFIDQFYRIYRASQSNEGLDESIDKKNDF